MQIDDKIKHLYLDCNIPMREIAHELEISVGTVFNRIHAMGIKPRKRTDYPRSEKQIEHIKKLGKSRKGKRMSDESKAKLSESRFKGGIGAKKKRTDGYISVYFPDHPLSNKDGYIMEHVLVMECAIGRHIKKDEVVHHKNGIRSDNRLSNLQLMTFREHSGYHMAERHRKKREEKNND